MVLMFSTGDLTELEATVARSYLDHQGLRGETIHGAEGFANVVAAARAAYRTLDVTVEDLVVTDDRAVARLRWRGTRPSGEHVERETREIIRIDEGKAVEHWGGPPLAAGPPNQAQGRADDA
jgi:ketosteroid isomerase-like protein